MYTSVRSGVRGLGQINVAGVQAEIASIINSPNYYAGSPYLTQLQAQIAALQSVLGYTVAPPAPPAAPSAASLAQEATGVVTVEPYTGPVNNVPAGPNAALVIATEAGATVPTAGIPPAPAAGTPMYTTLLNLGLINPITGGYTSLAATLTPTQYAALAGGTPGSSVNATGATAPPPTGGGGTPSSTNATGQTTAPPGAGSGTTGGATAAASGTILGMDPTTLLIVGGLVLGGLMVIGNMGKR